MGRKILISKEFLIEEYVNKNKSIAIIQKETGYSTTCITKALHRNHIPLRKQTQCVYCNQPLPEGSYHNKKFCNSRCMYKNRYRLHKKSIVRQYLRRKEIKILNKPTRYCQSCNVSLQGSHGLRLFCSSKCREKNRYIKHKEERNFRSKQYALKNKEKLQFKRHEWYEKNKEKIRQYGYNYRNSPEGKAKIKAYSKIANENAKRWQKRNRKKISENDRQKRLLDKNFLIIKRLRRLVVKSFETSISGGKTQSSKKYGIDYKAIIEHLKPFPENIKLYHIDHILPLCSFKFINSDGSIDFEEIKKAFAPQNHQWLLAEENLKKQSMFQGIMYRRNKK